MGDVEELLSLLPSGDVEFQVFLKQYVGNEQAAAGTSSHAEGQLSLSPCQQQCRGIQAVVGLGQCGQEVAQQTPSSLPGPAATAAGASRQLQQLQPPVVPVPAPHTAMGPVGCGGLPRLRAGSSSSSNSSSSGVQVPPSLSSGPVPAQTAGPLRLPQLTALPGFTGMAAAAASTAAAAAAAEPAEPAHHRALSPGALPVPAAAAPPPPRLPGATPSPPLAPPAPLPALRISSAPELSRVQPPCLAISRTLSASTLGLGVATQPLKPRKVTKMTQLETQVSRAQAANEALRAQLQQLQQDKQEAARQLSAVQHQLSLVQESNRHLQAQVTQNRGAVAALTKQLQAASLQEQGDRQQFGQGQWQWPQALQHMTG